MTVLLARGVLDGPLVDRMRGRLERVFPFVGNALSHNVGDDGRGVVYFWPQNAVEERLLACGLLSAMAADEEA